MTVMLDGTARIDSASISKRSVDLDTEHLSINRTVSSHTPALPALLRIPFSVSLFFSPPTFCLFSFRALLANRLRNRLKIR